MHIRRLLRNRGPTTADRSAPFGRNLIRQFPLRLCVQNLEHGCFERFILLGEGEPKRRLREPLLHLGRFLACQLNVTCFGVN